MEVWSLQESANRNISPIMPEYGPDINDFSPSWMEDGGGLSGGSESDPNLDYEQSYLVGKGTISAASWETETTSRQNQTPPDTNGGGSITVQTRDGGGFGSIIQQVTGVDTVTFDSSVFLIQDNGGGEVVVYCA